MSIIPKSDKDAHYIVVTGLTSQEDVTIVNTNAPKIRTSRYVKQILTELMREKAIQ